MSTADGTTTVDGNAIAGALLDVFGADMTARRGACEACGREAAFASTVVELNRRSAIVRCPFCTRTLFTILHLDAEPALVLGSLGRIRV
ncbi:DUF6510 family protein [Microbacterium halophytorum]|uniref:DUF6510 family protein n=1 Tax=Microbacterium halophytorum TaxID=2067568 RepID=UPI000CFDD8C2|nr:DUF6510 family protein [Microbacterium halophytorum]